MAIKQTEHLILVTDEGQIRVGHLIELRQCRFCRRDERFMVVSISRVEPGTMSSEPDGSCLPATGARAFKATNECFPSPNGSILARAIRERRRTRRSQ